MKNSTLSLPFGTGARYALDWRDQHGRYDDDAQYTGAWYCIVRDAAGRIPGKLYGDTWRW